MAQDLRSFLDIVKRRKADELVIVSREVDPAYEITALVVKLEREAGHRTVWTVQRLRHSGFPTCSVCARVNAWRASRRRRTTRGRGG